MHIQLEGATKVSPPTLNNTFIQDAKQKKNKMMDQQIFSAKINITMQNTRPYGENGKKEPS